MGSAALKHGASAGYRVLGIDRYDPPHQLGSSHAETRITRLAVGEGSQYLPFVARSHVIWRELEEQSGRPLFYQTGGYTIAPSGSSSSERFGDFVNVTAKIAAENNIAYEMLTPSELMRRHPNLVVAPDLSVGFEASAGVVLIEEAIDVQLTLARSAGAQTLVNHQVTAVEANGTGVLIQTAERSFRAAKAVITTGPWIGDLVPELLRHVEVYRQAVVWFDVDDPEPFTTDNFSYVMWPGQTISEYLALWPTPPGSVGLKAMREQFDEPCHPDSVARTVSQAEVEELYEQFIEGKVRGVRKTALQSTVCLYTQTPDEHFLVDYHPQSNNVIVASPCSGHGFKHSPALGEAMVQQLMSGASDLGLEPFSMRRLV